MPYLAQIATKINDSLRATSLADSRFQGGRYDAIAYMGTVQRDTGDMTLPMVSDGAGTYRAVVFDDVYPICIYHSCLGNSYQNTGTVYGDTKSEQICTSTMKMVVMALEGRINMTQEELEARIVTSFPTGLDFRFDGITTINTVPISSNMDKLAVYAQEYRGAKAVIAPDRILFSIQYKITAKYINGCWPLCGCSN
jgi:hypothetical protein